MKESTEYQELRKKYTQLQNDYYSMVDRYEDLKEKYQIAVNQNNTVYKLYESMKIENEKLEEQLRNS